jgi:hypothetical protein
VLPVVAPSASHSNKSRSAGNGSVGISGTGVANNGSSNNLSGTGAGGRGGGGAAGGHIAGLDYSVPGAISSFSAATAALLAAAGDARLSRSRSQVHSKGEVMTVTSVAVPFLYYFLFFLFYFRKYVSDSSHFFLLCIL